MIEKQNFFALFAMVVFMLALIVSTAKAGEHESTKVDIAIGPKDLIVTKLSDRFIEACIPIHNKGSIPLPRFHVYFYAGDPDKGGRRLSHPSQSAGPIMPGGSWFEAIHPQRLNPGEDTVSVVLDPDNQVEESDETNNKASRILSEIVSESEKVSKIEAIQKLDLSGDDILQVEARASEGFNFPYYLFIPGGIDKRNPVYLLVEPNNSGMVSDDPELHRAKALTLVKRSHANKMAKRLGVPLLVPTFPRPQPHTHSWAYTHALDIDTLEVLTGKLKRIDLQLTAMIKHAQELLRTNGFKINDKVFIHGFSASAKFCNRYAYLHPEMVKAAAAGGVNGLPTLPVRKWNGYELPFPIGLAGIERFASKPFDEKGFMQVAHYIYMGSSDTNDTLHPREASGPFEAWRDEEAAIIRKALAAEKMMPDRWELSRKIYRQQKLNAQLVTYNGVGHSIKGEMLDDVIDFFKANVGEKYVPIKPYEYPFAESKEIHPKDKTESAKTETSEKPQGGRMRYYVRLVVGKDKMTFQGQEVTWEELPPLLEKVPNRHQTVFQIASTSWEDVIDDPDKKTIYYSAEFDASNLKASKLCDSFGFEYFSFAGVHPLGMKGNSPKFIPHKK